MVASSRARSRRTISAMVPGVAAALLVGWICITRGGEILAALAACPPWVIAGATFAHLVTLTLRTEAWRTVLSGAGGERLGSRTLHAANAGAFLAGTVQGQAAMPARVALVRRLGGESAPSVSQIALADAPIFMLEVCTSALLAAIASTTVESIPAWAPWLLFLVAILALFALRLAHDRFCDRALAAGLGVLAAAPLRNRLVAIVLAFTTVALIRTWIVLVGFGLPSEPADVALVLFSMGAIGLLPIGVGTGPTATAAALGTTNLAAATAAGMVVSAATVFAVLLYAGACWSFGARFAARAGQEPVLGEPAEVIQLPVAAVEPELDVAA